MSPTPRLTTAEFGVAETVPDVAKLATRATPPGRFVYVVAWRQGQKNDGPFGFEWFDTLKKATNRFIDLKIDAEPNEQFFCVAMPTAKTDKNELRKEIEAHLETLNLRNDG